MPDSVHTRVFLLSLVCLVGLTLLSGCKGKQEETYFTRLSDAKGLSPENQVRWQGIAIGKVTSISIEEGKARVDIVLYDDYNGQIRHGVKAASSKPRMGGAPPHLQLYGGTDATAVVLPIGSEIPEAGLLETVNRTYVMLAGAGIVALALLMLCLKGLKRMIVFVLAAAFLIFSVISFKTQFDKYKSQLIGPELEKKLDELGDGLLTSPEAREAWDEIQQTAKDVIKEGGEESSSFLESLNKKLSDRFDEKTRELQDAGKADAADEIKDMKGRVQKILDQLENTLSVGRFWSQIMGHDEQVQEEPA